MAVTQDLNRRNILNSSIRVVDTAKAYRNINTETIERAAELIAEFTNSHGMPLETSIEAARPHVEAFAISLGQDLIKLERDTGTTMADAAEIARELRNQWQAVL